MATPNSLRVDASEVREAYAFERPWVKRVTIDLNRRPTVKVAYNPVSNKLRNTPIAKIALHPAIEIIDL